MSQSQGYKRFRSSINTMNYGTSTPQTTKSKIFPRASTPNPHPLDFFDQPTVPVPMPSSSPRPKVNMRQKVSRQRHQRRSNRQYQIYIDQIILVQGEKKLCSHCRCKKTRSERVIGIL